MKLSEFLKDKILILLLNLVCLLLLSSFLRMCGNSESVIILIQIIWLLILGIWVFTEYLRRRAFFKKADCILQQTDQQYLLGELLPKSHRLEDQLYRDMIRRSNKSVIERINEIEDDRNAYQEYIETWVHEIKAPITGIALICENQRGSGIQEFHTVAMENRRIENYVNMVLYLARSKDVYKDYLIQKYNLAEITSHVLASNRLYLIQNHVSAEIIGDAVVYTDEKWISFILDQIILNSVKYSGENPQIRFEIVKKEAGVILSVQDNGTGIPDNEIGRIFDKGFTGSNGRTHERSTGMGLYLCKVLCGKLGIDISAHSEKNHGTRMELFFPVSTYVPERRQEKV